jgi:hypothetical protein
MSSFLSRKEQTERRREKEKRSSKRKTHYYPLHIYITEIGMKFYLIKEYK